MKDTETVTLDEILYWQNRARREIEATLPGVVDWEQGERFDEIKNRHLSEAKAAIIKLFEQERTELLDALYWMYYQYCRNEGHLFMGAGETASSVLEDNGYIVTDALGVILKDNGDSNEQALSNSGKAE